MGVLATKTSELQKVNEVLSNQIIVFKGVVFTNGEICYV